MLNPIKKDLERLAHEILAQKETATATELLEKVQALYKALVILEHNQEQVCRRFYLNWMILYKQLSLVLN